MVYEVRNRQNETVSIHRDFRKALDACDLRAAQTGTHHVVVRCETLWSSQTLDECLKDNELLPALS